MVIFCNSRKFLKIFIKFLRLKARIAAIKVFLNFNFRIKFHKFDENKTWGQSRLAHAFTTHGQLLEHLTVLFLVL